MKLITPILFLIISTILFFVVIDPNYKEVSQLRSDVSTYSTALNNSNELQKTRDSLVDVYKGIKKEDRDRLAHLLPSTIGNIELILEIEKIASLRGMPIEDIRFEARKLENKDQANTQTDTIVVAESDPSEYLPYGIFPMEFVVEGRYDTFIEFLKDLEQNLRLVDIKSISFSVPVSTSGGNVDSSVYKYSLKVETYWLK